MKQSNTDYRQTYHFRGHSKYSKSEENSMVPDLPEVNDKIKENPYKQNVEIESEELVLRPDFSALHKAGGKKHSKGGTPVYLQPDSFVFSADKSLEINEKELELFELKKGGKVNTPAKVVEKNANPKVYNTLLNILDDKNKDNISKTSAAKMLEKYLDTLGKVAYIQESKKDFPQGIPSFAEGTAPVFEPNTKESIIENKQYMKYGGNVKMGDGGKPVSNVIKDKSGNTIVKYKDGTHDVIFPNGRVMSVDGNQKRMGTYSGDSVIWDDEASFDEAARLDSPTGQSMRPTNKNLANPYKPAIDINKYRLKPRQISDSEKAHGDLFQKFTNVPVNTSKKAITGNPYANGNSNAVSNNVSVENPTTETAPETNSTSSSKGNPVTTSKENSENEWGLWKGDKLPYFKNKFGVSNAADKISDLDAIAKELGYKGPKNNKAFQQWLYNSSPENKAIIDKWHKEYGLPNITKGEKERNMFDSRVGIRWQNAIKDILEKPVTAATPLSTIERRAIAPNVQAPKIETDLNPEKVTGEAQNGVPVDWNFTPWQKQSQLYNAAKIAMVDREMPIRSNYKATYMNPYLVNPEQTIADAKGVANVMMDSADVLNPIIANAQKASAYGEFLNRVPAIRSQVDNTNAQIINSTRAQNTAIKNDETLRNIGNDQQYYKEQVMGRQNFRNMRNFLGDQYMNNRMRDVETNQSLAYNMLTLGPKPAYGFDWNTGNFYRNEKNILDVQGDNREDTLQKYLDNVNFNDLSNSEKVKFIEVLTKKDALKYIRPQKKGGIIKNPYKK